MLVRWLFLFIEICMSI
jgi:hypothetical protein